MASNGTTLNVDLVDEIVRRVLVRLQGESQVINDSQTSGQFSGRLLTMAVLDKLYLADSLTVESSCVVTPEVKDELTRRKIKLHRRTEEKTRFSTNEPNRLAEWKVKAWALVESTTTKPLTGIRSFQSAGLNCQQRSCVIDLVSELKAQLSQDEVLNVVATKQPLHLQSALNREAIFAPIVDLKNVESLAEIVETPTKLVLVRTPILAWSLKRFLRVWNRLSDEGSC